MDKQILDMLNTRFDALDRRFDATDATGQASVKLLQCIDKKVAVNQTNITWHTWSLRGIWTAGVTGLFAWLGLR